MLFEIDANAKVATPVTPSTFSDLAFRERSDIQEWILACPRILGEELLIITAEFDQFDKTAERLDLLAVDRRGKLVVVELKRTAIGSKADLQALRYAAFCSTLGVDDISEILAAHIKRREGADIEVEEARQTIMHFVEDPAFEEFDDKPRIILGAEEFPPEITATLLWLRTFDLEVSAVRLSPYRVGTHLFIDSSVIIPLPEAEDYLIRRERKEERRTRGKGESYLQWFQALIDELRETHSFTNARAAQPQNWYSFASGIGRIHYSVVFTQRALRAEVYLDPGEKADNKRLFNALVAQRESIESEFGEQLSWERLDRAPCEPRRVV